MKNRFILFAMLLVLFIPTVSLAYVRNESINTKIDVYASYTLKGKAFSQVVTLLNANLDKKYDLLFTQEIYLVADTTIPTNCVSVVFERGGNINVGAYTLTLTGQKIVSNTRLPIVTIGIGGVTGTIDNMTVNAGWLGYGADGNTATENSTAVQNAIDFFPNDLGGTVEIPRGTVSCAPDIIDFTPHKGITLIGSSAAYGYDSSFPGSVMSFTTGGIGISAFDETILSTVCAYNQIRNLKIEGNDVLTTGIKLNSNNSLIDVTVTQCVDHGIFLGNYTNQLVLNRVCSYDNVAGLGYGLFSSGKDLTLYTLQNVNLRANKIGWRLEGGKGVSVRDCVIESNSAEGLYVLRPSSNVQLAVFSFDHVWFENNYKGGTGYSIVFDSTYAGLGDEVARYFNFDYCEISASAAGKHLYLKRGYEINFRKCSLLAGDTANGVYIEDTENIRRVYFRGGEAIEPTSNGKYWSAEPTAYTPIHNRTYEVSRPVVSQAQSTTSSVLEIGNMAVGDTMSLELSVSGSLPASDLGFRKYIGVIYRQSSTINVTYLYPVRLADVTPFVVTDPVTPTDAASLQVDLVANAFPSIESEVGSQLYGRSGSFLTLSIEEVTQPDPEDFRLVLTTGNWAGSEPFNGVVTLRAASNSYDVTIH